MPKIGLKELTANPKLIEEYVKWRSQEMTDIVMGILKDLSGPKLPSIELMDKPHVCAALHNQRCGAEWAISKAMSLDESPADRKQEEVEANYGAEDILKKHGLVKQ